MSNIGLLDQQDVYYDISSYKRNVLSSTLRRKNSSRRFWSRSSSYASLDDKPQFISQRSHTAPTTGVDDHTHFDVNDDDDDNTTFFAKQPYKSSWKASVLRTVGLKNKQYF